MCAATSSSRARSPPRRSPRRCALALRTSWCMVMPCKVAPVPQADTGAGGGRPRGPPGEAVGRWTGERSVRDGGVGRDLPPAVEGGLLLAPPLVRGASKCLPAPLFRGVLPRSRGGDPHPAPLPHGTRPDLTRPTTLPPPSHTHRSSRCPCAGGARHCASGRRRAAGWYVPRRRGECEPGH